MKSIDILCSDTIYADMLRLELEDAGYIAGKGRSRSADLILLDLDSSQLMADNVPTLTFSRSKPADLVRPFGIEELLKLAARLIGSNSTDTHSNELYVPAKRTYAQYNGEKIELSELEHSLLRRLYIAQGNAVSTGELSSKVFGEKDNKNLVRVYISYLRNKLDERFAVKFITTVRGKGYMLTCAREEVSR